MEIVELLKQFCIGRVERASHGEVRLVIDSRSTVTNEVRIKLMSLGMQPTQLFAFLLVGLEANDLGLVEA